MENLNSEELKQLVSFYRQKSSDLEFQVLQLQIKNNKLVLELQASKEEPIPAVKTVKNK